MTSPIKNLNGHRIVVTGATGFLGKWLVARLLGLGGDVLGIDVVAGSVDAQNSSYQHVTANTGDAREAIGTFWADVPADQRGIFHLAGLADGGICQRDPQAALAANVGATGDMLDAVRTGGPARIIFPSTGLVYGDKMDHPVNEMDELEPVNFYAHTKLIAEKLVVGWVKNFGGSAVIARLSNVYGPECSPQTVIGRILQQMAEGRSLTVKNPEPVRDFIYIKDVIEGLIRLYQATFPEKTVTVNLSTGIGTQIRDLVIRIGILSGAVNNIVESTDSNRIFSSNLVLANQRLRKITDWRPRINIETGLKRCIEWESNCYE